MKIKGVPSQEGTPFFCHRLKRTASNEEALPGNMPGQSRARYLRAAGGTQNRFPVSNRPAKLDGLMKPPGKAGRFDETTRRSAGGSCFMPRGARFGVGRRANWAAKQNPALRTESGETAYYSSCKSFDQPSLSNAKNSRLISMATMAASVMPDRATLPSDSVTPDRPTTKTTEVRTMLRFLL